MKKVELFNDHFQNEVLKNIPEYEDYQVSNYGRVKSSDRIIKQYGHKGFYERVMRGKILKPRTQNGGYLIVWLSRNGKSIAKPVPLLQYLIQIFTDPGDVVIDPCAGSGTTLHAAKTLGRRAYGFEIKKDFFKKANLLLNNNCQLELFT